MNSIKLSKAATCVLIQMLDKQFRNITVTRSISKCRYSCKRASGRITRHMPLVSLQANQCLLKASFSSTIPQSKKETVSVTFLLSNGKKEEVQAKVGDNLLDIIIENDIDIDGFGACEGTLACSTCHLIFKQADFDKIPDPATDEELDMLDLAYGLTDTSRLGCQVIVTKEMDGMEVKVPDSVSDARGGAL